MKSAEFRTMREMMGMDQTWVADQLKVDRRTLARWEGPNDKYEPPFFVEEWILEWWDLFQERVNEALDLCAEQAEDFGEPSAVMLSRFASEESFERANTNEGWTWGMHSALMGLVAFSLQLDGYTVEVGFSPEEP